VLLCLLLSCCTSGKVQNPDALSLLAELDKEAGMNRLTRKEKKQGWMLFSDGKSFDNWHGFNMDEVPDCWIIEDGAFKVLTEGGEESNKGLVTDKVYKEFALSLEFKVEKAANSGKWTDYPDYGKYDEGHIVLQNHSTTVWYRNIKLKEL